MAGITRPRRTTPTRQGGVLSERRVRHYESAVLPKLGEAGKPAARAGRKDARKKPKARPYSPPPVLARTPVLDMAVPPRKRAQPRHRYDIALNFPGAEAQLPSLPMLRLGWRAASGLLVLLMALSLFLLLNTTAFQVDVLEVEGLGRLTLEDIQVALNISGEAIVKIDPETLRTELQEAFPELSSIKVSVYLPARVKLDLVERTPVISWVQRDGNGNSQEKWVDQEGIAFPPRGAVGNLLRVEAEGDLQAGRINGLNVNSLEKSGQGKTVDTQTPLLSAEMVNALLAMKAYVPEGTPILLSVEHGFGWEDPHGWRVYLGKNLAEMNQKLLIYQKFVEKLAEQGIEPSMVSVEFLHAPFYRTER